MVFFWKKHKNIQEMLDAYQESLDKAVAVFAETMGKLLDEGASDAFQQGVLEVHRCESHIDDLRREIEITLYGRQLLPESRGDLLGLLEAIDRIPNALETVVFICRDEQVEIPDSLRADLRELIEINIAAYHLVRKALDALLHNPSETLYVCKEVDVKESESDRLERRIIRQIYSSDDELARKMQLRDLVLGIGRISDIGENCADRIVITAIKRNV